MSFLPPPRPPLLLMLLLLLLLSSVPSSLCFSYLPNDRIFGDWKLKVDLNVNKTVLVGCPFHPGFKGITDISSSEYLTVYGETEVDLSVDTSNYTAVQILRKKKLGVYHCVYETIFANSSFGLVLTELPDYEDYSHLSVHPRDNPEVFCPLEKDAGDKYVWEKFNEKTGLFDFFKFGDRIGSSEIHSKIKFTTVRCFAIKRPAKAWYIGFRRSIEYLRRQLRETNYFSVTQPLLMTVGSVINLVCSGRDHEIKNKNDTKIYIRRKGALIDPTVAYPEGMRSVVSLRSVLLLVSGYRPEYEGVYLCDKDGVRQGVRLVTDYGYPVLSKSGRQQLKPNGASESLTCKSSAPKVERSVSFVVKRQGKPPLRLRAGYETEEFAVKAEYSGRLYLTFKATDEMENAEVECWVRDKKISVKYIRN